MKAFISQEAKKKAFVKDYLANKNMTLELLKSDYKMGKRAVKSCCKQYHVKVRRSKVLPEEAQAFVDFYTQAPCLLEECLDATGFYRSRDTLTKIFIRKLVPSWGTVKITRTDVDFHRLERTPMNENFAYFYGLLCAAAKLYINQFGKKVVFLGLDYDFSSCLVTIITMLARKPRIDYIGRTNNRNKIIFEDNYFYDLVERLQKGFLRGTIPVSKEYYNSFLRAFFEVNGFFRYRNRNDRDRPRTFLVLSYYNREPLKKIISFFEKKVYNEKDGSVGRPKIAFNNNNNNKFSVTWVRKYQINPILEFLYDPNTLDLYSEKIKQKVDEELKVGQRVKKGEK